MRYSFNTSIHVMQNAVSVMIVYLLTVYWLQTINFYADAQNNFWNIMLKLM